MGKAEAARALCNLAVNSDNQIAIACTGAVEPLAQLLRIGDAIGKTQAARTLGILAVYSDNQVAIARAGAQARWSRC
eukprot:4032434-Pyramimonas_sp.AAC.1